MKITISTGLFCLLLPFGSLSQTLLITEYSSAQVQLTATDSARFQQVSDTAYSTDARIVSIADIRTSAQQNDTLHLILPGASDTIFVAATQVEENTQLGFLWAGKLLNHQGYFAYNRKENLTAGFLMCDGSLYEILPVDTNYQFFVKRSKLVAPEGCGVPGVTPPPGITLEPPACPPDYNTCPALVTVLVIVDEFAKAELENSWGGMGFFVKMGEIMVNIAFLNSDIPNKSIRTVFIEKSGFNFSFPPDGTTDLEELRNWSSVERAANQADLVVLLTGEKIPAGGVAFGGDPASNKAYAIVEVNNFILEGAFAHELGHLFGCRHNWPATLGDNEDSTCAHAYRRLAFLNLPPPSYSTINSWRTIVGVPLSIEPGALFQYEGQTYRWYENWILHYSNPDVDYYGAPTGVTGANPANNARQIRNSACAVADYFPSQELAVFVTATSACDPPVTFTASIIEPEAGLPGVGPYTVNWYWSATGIFDSQTSHYIGSGATIEVQLCPSYWIRCTVVSSDGVVVNRIYKVQAPIECECELTPGGGSEGKPATSAAGLLPGDSGKLTIQPNPVRGSQVYVHSQTFSGRGDYQLLDLTGQVLASGQLHLLPEIPASIPLPQAVTGLLICRVILENGESYSHKLIIQNQ